MDEPIRPPRSHGTRPLVLEELGAVGEGCVVEHGVLVAHPERIFLDRAVYVGPMTILEGYHLEDGTLHVGEGCWIGPQCFLHAAGGIRIGPRVGIGPQVCILTSAHQVDAEAERLLDAPLRRAPVTIEEGADVGARSVLLPGVTVGRGAQVGAGSVVTRDVPPYAVVVGVPARVLRHRWESVPGER